MPKYAGVRFQNGGKVYHFLAGDLPVKSGDHVIVETAHGPEYGEAATDALDFEPGGNIEPTKEIVRIATDADAKQDAFNRKKEADAFKICEQKIANHKLEMKLIEVNYNFDGSKVIFFFTADGRVDFRELVKDLASTFRTRIELRQIGVRDEAKMLGGFGVCGKPFCCATFLNDFQPVSIKMAKEQGLSMNPAKISGACGRLMCCLKYEQNAYEELQRITPRVGSTVDTPEGRGTVCESSLLKGIVKVQIERSSDVLPKQFNVSEVKILRSARAQREEVPKELQDLSDN
ncbi:MAG TPA: stage 0 sporulation family protein [Oscillospiraceae bacterium]|nr:stage 0 sporulation family protein [Oscillospiraceae bacterium]HPF55172.1 stage 0 sporulation family protein [Clostridiales bacterium]HPK34589.1 stage 0 sporulation family protein [Oscillospiraceae bacterium]HPR75947.1 stage 0 sporulation family protein [Oscillospiraceae bacterium]